jgi:ABC-2 type transport system permease protein
MKGLGPLLRKELMEQLRTYKLVIVGGAFLFFGITTPLLLKYLPEILKLAGEEMTIALPPPTAVMSLAEYAGTIGQVGLLMAVLVAMGAVANERSRGTASIVLSKPVSRAAFVNAKLIAASLTFLVSLAAASVVCFAYTVWLIEGTGVWPFVLLNLMVGLFLVLSLAVTLLFSSLTKSSLAAGGLAILVLISQAGLSALPLIGDYMPGKLLSWGIVLLSGGNASYWWALGITIGLIGLCLYLSNRSLSTKDL